MHDDLTQCTSVTKDTIDVPGFTNGLAHGG